MRLATSFILALLCARADTLPEILARMNADSLKFKGVVAQLTRIEYIAVLKEPSEEKAVLTLLKNKNSITALLDYKSPDVKDILFRDGKVNEYLPKLNLIREYDLGKYSSVVNQFVTLGFGASGKDLQKNYKIDLRGAEILKIADKDVKVTKLELTPRAAEAMQYMKKIEFWIPDGASYAVQLKIYQPSGDTNTAIYSDVQINPPSLNDHSVELKTPKNVAREKVNK
jgi:outer membrane lipoprotein-sorting protein